MHYYKRNLGDYAKKAGRLSMLQHGSYTLLIDACYDREQFPTHEEAIEWIWASTTDEVEAVTFVLKKFFTLEGNVYVQKRIQEEIAEYHAKASTNQRIAIERETKRKEKSTNRARAVNEAPPNQEPLTNNHKPVTKDKTASPSAYADLLSSVPKQIIDDWIALRKTKKATVTRTAIEEIISEAGKAGYTLEKALTECCARGWAGFKASWLDEKHQSRAPPNPNKQEALEVRNRAVADRMAEKMSAGATQ
jgi:uncharacterized protein YdaU (DUF1376 family)